MSATRQARFLERVRRLLALAEHPGTGEEEAALASAQAAAMMLTYGLEESAVRSQSTGKPEPIDGFDFDISNRGGHGRELCWSLNLIAIALGCQTAQHWSGAYRSRGMRSALHMSMTFVGPEPVLDSLKILLPSLLLQMETQVVPALRQFTATEVSSELTKGERAYARTSFRRAFYVGFGSAVAAKLRDRVTDIAQQVKGTGAELVLQGRDARVRADYERRFPGIRPVRETGVDRDGWSSGREAGQHADLGDRSVAILAIAELTT